MATRKPTSKRAARKPGRTAAKRSASLKARKSGSNRKPRRLSATCPQVQHGDSTFTRMLDNIFGMGR